MCILIHKDMFDCEGEPEVNWKIRLILTSKNIWKRTLGCISPLFNCNTLWNLQMFKWCY